MAIPLSHDYREAVVLLIAMAPSALLTLSLNKRHGRQMSGNSVSLLLASALVIGGAMAEILKLLLGTGDDWSYQNSLITIFAIWTVSALLNYAYIVKGHARK